MSRELPSNPSLEHLKKQAKALLRAFGQADPDAVARLSTALADRKSQPKLADAQHAIAREYGFASWAKLKDRVESVAALADPVATLVMAVKINDTGQARHLLDSYPELKQRLNDPLPGLHFEGTLLLAAVSCANREMIDLLIQAGADINQKSHWWAGGFGGLDDAAGDDKPGWLAPYLIEKGAEVDIRAAVQLRLFDRIKELVSADPTLVHARGGDGQTPLHVAPTVEIAEFLLDRGADIDATDIDHESTPAQYLIRDRQEVARYLVSKGCRTDILMAAALGDIGLVRKHLKADPACVLTSVSERYFPKSNRRAGGTIYIWTLGQNKTAHIVAREFGHEDIYRLLIERSPDELKLAIACEVGDEATVNELAASRPGIVRTQSEVGLCRLPDAAQDDNMTAVRLMLEAGWPVGARGQHGGTALHWAAWHGNAEMVRVILKHNPPLEQPDSDFGGAPLGWAIHASVNGWHPERGDYAGAVEALLQAGAVAPELTDDLDASEPVRATLRRKSK